MNADVDGGRGFVQRVARLLERGNAARGNIEAAALGRKLMRDRETDTLAGAGNKRTLSFQSQVHRQSSLRTRLFRRFAVIKSVGHRMINSSHAARGKERAPQPVSA